MGIKLPVTSGQFEHEFEGFPEYIEEMADRIEVIDQKELEDVVYFIKPQISALALVMLALSALFLYLSSEYSLPYRAKMKPYLQYIPASDFLFPEEEPIPVSKVTRMPQEKLLKQMIALINVPHVSDLQIKHAALYFVAEANKALFPERKGSLISYVRDYLREYAPLSEEETYARVRAYSQLLQEGQRLSNEDTYKLMGLFGHLADIEYKTFEFETTQ